MSHAGKAILAHPLNTDKARQMFKMQLKKTQVAVCNSTLMAMSVVFAQQQRINTNSPWQCNTGPSFTLLLSQKVAPAPPCTIPTSLSLPSPPFTLTPPSSTDSLTHNNHHGDPMPLSNLDNPTEHPILSWHSFPVRCQFHLK